MDRTITIKEPLDSTPGVVVHVVVGSGGLSVDVSYADTHTTWSGAAIPTAVKTAAEAFVKAALSAGKSAMGF